MILELQLSFGLTEAILLQRPRQSGKAHKYKNRRRLWPGLSRQVKQGEGTALRAGVYLPVL